MGLSDKFINKLAKKVFATGKLASSATFYAESSAAYDDYGAKIDVAESGSTVKIVPYNLFGGRINYVPFGDLDEGDMDAVVPYDTSVSLDQKVTLAGTNYRVKSYENYLVEDTVVAVAIRLAKIQ